MARGFRKVVTVFIEEVIDSDPVIAKFVSDLRQMNGTKCCDKSKRFIDWLNKVILSFKLNDNKRLELLSILIKFIFKRKMISFIRKINDYKPDKYNFTDVTNIIDKFCKLSNKPTAAERKLFLGHSIIRLGKSLYDKYPHFEPIFWKEDYSKLKPVCQPKLNSSKNQCNGDQSLNEDYEENHSQSKEAHIDPAILAKQREKILNLMSSVIKIKIQKNEFFE